MDAPRGAVTLSPADEWHAQAYRVEEFFLGPIFPRMVDFLERPRHSCHEQSGESMSTLVRRAVQAASLTAVTGATAVLLSAPALAAPVAPSEDCAAPIDGATVCLVRSTDEFGSRQVTATLTIEDGRVIVGGLVAVEACSGECHSWRVATGQNVTNISTQPVLVGKGTGYYRANASWVDDAGHVHTGVLAS